MPTTSLLASAPTPSRELRWESAAARRTASALPTRIGTRDRHLFEAYTDRREDCHKLAQAIREGVESGVLPPASDEDDDGALEGRLLTKMHRPRERNPSLSRKRKKKMRDELGELRCEVCALSETTAEGLFGELTGDVFECHHTKPLHTLTGTTKTLLADLAVVCPTCHRALHRIEPPISVGDLRARVTTSSATS